MLTPTTFADQTFEIIAADENFQLVKIEIPMNIPSDNVLPWGAVYGTVKDHVDGYPVIIQIYKNDDPVHFAQTDVNDDGSYEYKFRIKSVNGDVVINVFEGDYDVKIFYNFINIIVNFWNNRIIIILCRICKCKWFSLISI